MIVVALNWTGWFDATCFDGPLMEAACPWEAAADAIAAWRATQ